MDCQLIRLDLVAFHFGDLDDETRRRVEAHLPACGACLQAFLALKRSIESADSRLSETARARLRAAVAREIIAVPRSEPAWPWWQRPLAVALATAAVFLALSTVSALASSPGAAPLAWPKPPMPLNASDATR